MNGDARLLVVPILLAATALPATAEDLDLTLRHRVETAPDTGRYHAIARDETWDAAHTALIVCDVWDLHHCLNAVRRAEEFAPRLNNVVRNCRERGVTIIHAPSGCMETYAEHPARLRAVNTPQADHLPDDIRSWCSIIPAEEEAVYPIDQSDGGEDDDPAEHAEWAAELESRGRDPKAPWKSQSDLIEIDGERDYISDRGDEVWSILQERGIENVILTGVHTNMCVLGRPFGLRQMARNGKNVVLMRDMTDTMYNPAMWPYVSHFTGTDLIVEHIEKFVCPTITSDQVIGGETFVFANDDRPHVAIVMAEDEYETADTLPPFASQYLGKDFRVSLVFGNETERNDIPGLAILDEADVLLVSIRRRPLPPEQLDAFRRFVSSGKPVVGIRTASHPFHMRNQDPPAGLDDWPEWDAEVFGGNYHNHYGNDLQSSVQIIEEQGSHPILTAVRTDEFAVGGSLYVTSPLADGATALMTGRVDGKNPEPVAWTYTREDGGRSFYTSLGYRSDFEGNPDFQRLLLNGIYWAAGLDVPDVVSQATAFESYERHWTPVPVPASLEAQTDGVLAGYEGPVWYRCMLRVPSVWERDFAAIGLSIDHAHKVWWNGTQVRRCPKPETTNRFCVMKSEEIEFGDLNMLVVRVDDPRRASTFMTTAPDICVQQVSVEEFRAGWRVSDPVELNGAWQFRIGDDPEYAAMALPAKFAASTDVVFEVVDEWEYGASHLP